MYSNNLSYRMRSNIVYRKSQDGSIFLLVNDHILLYFSLWLGITGVVICQECDNMFLHIGSTMPTSTGSAILILGSHFCI